MHLFKEYAEEYLSKGYSVIPDGFKKKFSVMRKEKEGSGTGALLQRQRPLQPKAL